jgi:hypothetical protein
MAIYKAFLVVPSCAAPGWADEGEHEEYKMNQPTQLTHFTTHPLLHVLKHGAET